MKRISIAALILVVALLTATAAFALSPKNISASWNASNNTLKVTAEHSVKDPSLHYVKSMTIFLGSKQLKQKQYSSQSSAEQFSDTITLKLLPSGTKIRIRLVCNIKGSAETEFRIP